MRTFKVIPLLSYIKECCDKYNEYDHHIKDEDSAHSSSDEMVHTLPPIEGIIHVTRWNRLNESVATVIYKSFNETVKYSLSTKWWIYMSHRWRFFSYDSIIIMIGDISKRIFIEAAYYYRKQINNDEQKENKNKDEMFTKLSSICNIIASNTNKYKWRLEKELRKQMMYNNTDSWFESEFDCQKHLIGLQNGVYNMHTHTVHDGSPKDYISMSTYQDWNYSYHWEHPDIQDVIFFIKELLPNDNMIYDTLYYFNPYNIKDNPNSVDIYFVNGYDIKTLLHLAIGDYWTNCYKWLSIEQWNQMSYTLDNKIIIPFITQHNNIKPETLFRWAPALLWIIMMSSHKHTTQRENVNTSWIYVSNYISKWYNVYDNNKLNKFNVTLELCYEWYTTFQKDIDFIKSGWKMIDFFDRHKCIHSARGILAELSPHFGVKPYITDIAELSTKFICILLQLNTIGSKSEEETIQALHSWFEINTVENVEQIIQYIRFSTMLPKNIIMLYKNAHITLKYALKTPKGIEVLDNALVWQIKNIKAGRHCTSSPRFCDIPDEYKCCIDMELMKDPVLASDGFNYERFSIEKWILQNPSDPRSPRTREQLSIELYPNRILRNQITEYTADHLRYYKRHHFPITETDNNIEDNRKEILSCQITLLDTELTIKNKSIKPKT